MPNQPLQFPPHLQGRYRRFRAREKSQRNLLLPRIFILPHSLIGLCCLLFAMPGSVIWAIAGDDYTASVTRIWIENGRKRSITYRAAFTYTLPTGPRQTSDTIDSDQYHRLDTTPPEQRTLRVRAIKVGPIFFDKPIDNSSGAWTYVVSVWFFSLFWCGITGIFVHFLYIQPYRQRLLYRSGEITAGTIVSKYTRRAKSTTYYLRYAFTLPDGRHFEKVMPTRQNLWQSAEVNQPVTVLYSPSNPKRSIVYDYGPYECIAD
jgi:hypothetical protein